MKTIYSEKHILRDPKTELFGGELSETMVLANPISSELDAMRPSILGNLLLAAGRNASGRTIVSRECRSDFRSIERLAGNVDVGTTVRRAGRHE